MKQPQQLISEQLPNDGSHQPSTYLKKANERLKRDGKHGKTATIKISGKNLALQFSFEGQKQKGINQPFTIEGVKEAERLARIVSAQLEANRFTWNWFDDLLGKPSKQPEAEKQLTCDEMIKQYKKHYFKQRTANKSAKATWRNGGAKIEKALDGDRDFLTLKKIQQIIESTQNNTEGRTRTIDRLIDFLDFFGIEKYSKIILKYKKQNNPKRKKRNIPSDSQIISVYHSGFIPVLRCAKKYLHRYPQWQFLYGLLATYGLRIHEAWNIANWDKPVILKDGDWVSVIDAEDNSVETQYKGETVVIPAILDPNNEEYILCIGHETKTGYRMAIPLSPDGHDWIKEFNLIQALNLPDIPNPLKRAGKDETVFNCTVFSCRWFRDKGYGFTPHSLRHAYNHRGHSQGINTTTLSQSLGHGIRQNTTTYLRDMSDETKVNNFKKALKTNKENRSYIEELENEIKNLKAENQALKVENKKLRVRRKQKHLNH